MICITLKNCKLKISFWFATILAIVSVLDKSGIICSSIIAAIIHEAGHIFAMMITKTIPNEIIIREFKVDIIDNNRNKRGYKEDIFILLSGAVINLLIAIIMFFIYKHYNFEIIYYMFICNLLLAIVNLLPLVSLDGGQIFYALLLNFVKEKTARRILEICSIIILIPSAILGFYILLKSRYNFSLLAVSIYLIIHLLKKAQYY